MAIKAEFVCSAVNAQQCPKDYLPEIAMVGRSNVGKSSLINCLLGTTGLVRVSNTPGRTQTLNYYKVTPDTPGSRPFYLVDMPGYGFAKASKVKRDEWAKFIHEYLTTREQLRAVVHLIDLRHTPQPLDHEMSHWLREIQSFIVVGTKADKIAVTKVPEALLQVAEELNLDSDHTTAFSAKTNLGRNTLWNWVLAAVTGNG
ncbi:MAG: ribosome biogenesis GTP-binding protein YihA/YsxC [bacterium]